MTAGRTTWSARDAAHHDRELVVELLDEFGPAGPYVDTVLRDLAQQQRDGGAVRTGFRVLEKKCGISRDEARTIVEYAANIGLFDDLAIDADGRRFTVRVSGWEADQRRGRNAVRQDESRSTRHDESDAVTENVTGSPETLRRHGPPARASRVDQTRPNQEHPPTPAEAGGTVLMYRRRAQPPARVTLAEQILASFNEQTGMKLGAYTGDGRASDSLKRIIGALVDFPTLDAETADRLIETALKRPWWDGPASVGVVFGPGVIERNLAAANGHGVRNIKTADLAAALRREPAPNGGAA